MMSHAANLFQVFQDAIFNPRKRRGGRGCRNRNGSERVVVLQRRFHLIAGQHWERSRQVTPPQVVVGRRHQERCQRRRIHVTQNVEKKNHLIGERELLMCHSSLSSIDIKIFYIFLKASELKLNRIYRFQVTTD
jgi:hypothetical protein